MKIIRIIDQNKWLRWARQDNIFLVYFPRIFFQVQSHYFLIDIMINDLSRFNDFTISNYRNHHNWFRVTVYWLERREESETDILHGQGYPAPKYRQGTHVWNRKEHAVREEKCSYRPKGAMDALNVAPMHAAKHAYIIYCVLSPAGPSVMAVLCPIKITTGASRPAHRRLGGPAIELIYFPNIRLDLHFVTGLAWRRDRSAWKLETAAPREPSSP